MLNFKALLNWTVDFLGDDNFYPQGVRRIRKAAKPLTAALREQKFSPPDPLFQKTLADLILRSYKHPSLYKTLNKFSSTVELNTAKNIIFGDC